MGPGLMPRYLPRWGHSCCFSFTTGSKAIDVSQRPSLHSVPLSRCQALFSISHTTYTTVSSVWSLLHAGTYIHRFPCLYQHKNTVCLIPGPDLRPLPCTGKPSLNFARKYTCTRGGKDIITWLLKHLAPGTWSVTDPWPFFSCWWRVCTASLTVFPPQLVWEHTLLLPHGWEFYLLW